MFEDQFNHERVNEINHRNDTVPVHMNLSFAEVSSEDPIPHDGCLYAPPTNRHAPNRD